MVGEGWCESEWAGAAERPWAGWEKGGAWLWLLLLSGGGVDNGLRIPGGEFIMNGGSQDG